jgi:hypothetical protein
VYNSQHLEIQKVAIVWRVVQNTRKINCRLSWAGDSGRSLLTGGRCSEVAVSAGLTVYILNIFKYVLNIKEIIFSIKF